MIAFDDHSWSIHTPILSVMAGMAFIWRESVTVPYMKVVSFQLAVMLLVCFGVIFMIRLWALCTKRFNVLRAVTVYTKHGIRANLICLTFGVVMLYYAWMNGTHHPPIMVALWFVIVFTGIYTLILGRLLSLAVVMIERYDDPFA